jgi:hypothetical protein
VSESVAAAEAAIEWGRYAGTYPWIALGGAVAAGYFLYASSHQKVAGAPASLDDGAKPCEPVARARAKGQQRFRTGQNLLIAAWNILYPVAVHAAQNYMLHWLEEQYPARTVDRTARSPSAGAPGARMVRVER